MATGVTAARMGQGYLPNNEMLISFKRLFKELFHLEGELFFKPNQRIVFTGVAQGIQITPAQAEQEQYLIGHNSLPAGCRFIITGMNPAISPSGINVAIKCPSPWKIGIHCNAEEFQNQTGQPVSDLINIIDQL